jgi:hypothetical protein
MGRNLVLTERSHHRDQIEIHCCADIARFQPDGVLTPNFSRKRFGITRTM